MTSIFFTQNPGIGGLDVFTSAEVAQLLALLASPSLGFLVATGAVNQMNAAFTFTVEPSYIVSDGVWYRVNKGWTWNAGTLTATLTVPPTFDIWGVE